MHKHSTPNRVSHRYLRGLSRPLGDRQWKTNSFSGRTVAHNCLVMRRCSSWGLSKPEKVRLWLPGTLSEMAVLKFPLHPIDQGCRPDQAKAFCAHRSSPVLGPAILRHWLWSAPAIETASLIRQRVNLDQILERNRTSGYGALSLQSDSNMSVWVGNTDW